MKCSESYDFENVNLIWAQLKNLSTLSDLLCHLQPDIRERWNHDGKLVHFGHLSEEHQRTAAQIEAMFPCCRPSYGLIFVEIFLVLETQSESNNSNPPIIKVSLGLLSETGSQCSTCEVDSLGIFNIDMITLTGAVAVQVPLPTHRNPLGLARDMRFITRVDRGTWDIMASREGLDTVLSWGAKIPSNILDYYVW